MNKAMKIIEQFIEVGDKEEMAKKIIDKYIKVNQMHGERCYMEEILVNYKLIKHIVDSKDKDEIYEICRNELDLREIDINKIEESRRQKVCKRIVEEKLEDVIMDELYKAGYKYIGDVWNHLNKTLWLKFVLYC